MGFFLSFACVILGFVFKYMKVILNPAVLTELENLGVGML